MNAEDDVFERIKEKSLQGQEVAVREPGEQPGEEQTQQQQLQEQEATFDKDTIRHMSSVDLFRSLNNSQAMKKEVFILELLIKREGKSCVTSQGTLTELLQNLYRKAGRVHDWNVIRHCSGALRKIVDSLAPAISTILVHGKVVSSALFIIYFLV